MVDWGVVARAFHVLAVVVWIGGVWLVTMALLPAMKHEPPDAWLEQFGAIERRFAPQARVCLLIVLLSGVYMLYEYHLWSRLTHIAYWWMHVMIGVWLVFAVLLFLIEPLRSLLRIEQRLAADPGAALLRASRLHRILLALSLIAIFVSVCGAHGLL